MSMGAASVKNTHLLIYAGGAESMTTDLQDKLPEAVFNDDGLIILSPTGGSGISLMDAFSCERKVYWRLQGWRGRRKPFYFAFGTIQHRNAFRPYTGAEIKESEIPNAAAAEVAQVCEAGVTYDEREKVTTEVEFSSKTERSNAPRVAHAQMRVWGNRRYETGDVIKVEHRMISPLVNPDSGNIDGETEGVFATGRVDLVLKGPRIRDLKTAKTKLGVDQFQAFGYLVQLGTYRYLWAARFSENVKDVGIFQLSKNVKPETVEKNSGEVIPRRPLRYRKIYNMFREAGRIIRDCKKTGRWQQRASACEGKFSPCPFIPLCYRDQFDNPDEVIENNLIRREF